MVTTYEVRYTTFVYKIETWPDGGKIESYFGPLEKTVDGIHYKFDVDLGEYVEVI